jgi:hypothetical protein
LIEVLELGLADAARVEYDALFARCAGAYIQQSTLWAEAIAGIGPDEPVFLLARRHGVAVAGLPLYLFRGAAGNIMTSVPQAGPLGGIFVHPGEDKTPAYAALLARAQDLARQHDCLCMSVITNPLEDDLALYERWLQPDLVLDNFTQVIPLERVVSHGQWILADNASRNPGKTIKVARSAGFTSRTTDSLDEFERWYGVHERRYAELQLTPLPRVLLRNLFAHLRPSGNACLHLVLAGDEIAAGSLLVRHRDVCDVLVISMDMKYAAQSPSYLLFQDVLLALAAQGVRWMNWQSSPRRSDGVYKFKKQWGSEERPYHFVTKLFCAPEQLMAMGVDGVRKHYPGHYVAPFGAFSAGFSQRRYAKP